MRKMSEIFGLEMVVPFLMGDNSPEAQQHAAQWIYANYADLAYSGFLKHGRGVLMGPVAKDDDGQLLNSGQLQDALFETGQNWGVSVSYLPATQDDLGIAIPEEGIRKLLMPALDNYDPQLEVPIVLIRDGKARTLFPGFHSKAASPQDLYEKANQPGSDEKVRVPERFPAAGERWKTPRYAPAFVPIAAR
jgi:hypothetical protein